MQQPAMPAAGTARRAHRDVGAPGQQTGDAGPRWRIHRSNEGLLVLQEEVLHAVRAATRQDLGPVSVLRADRAAGRDPEASARR